MSIDSALMVNSRPSGRPSIVAPDKEARIAVAEGVVVDGRGWGTESVPAVAGVALSSASASDPDSTEIPTPSGCPMNRSSMVRPISSRLAVSSPSLVESSSAGRSLSATRSKVASAWTNPNASSSSAPETTRSLAGVSVSMASPSAWLIWLQSSLESSAAPPLNETARSLRTIVRPDGSPRGAISSALAASAIQLSASRVSTTPVVVGSSGVCLTIIRSRAAPLAANPMP